MSSRVAIHVDVGENLQLLSSGPASVEANADDLVIPLAVRRYADDRHSYVLIDVRPSEDASVKDVLGPCLNIVLSMREALWFWPVILLLVVFLRCIGIRAQIAASSHNHCALRSGIPRLELWLRSCKP